MKKPLRIGLVGCGFVSINHLDGYATIPEQAKVVAVADPDPKARQARVETYGIERSFASLAEMLVNVELDAVDIASPREFHAEDCLLAARHGLPILCQKPLAPSYDEAVALIESLPSDTRLMVHENWRFRPHYRVAAEWLAQGRIGHLRQAVMFTMTSGLLKDSDGELPALSRQPMMAGLSRLLLMEVMIHHVDVLRFLLGPLDLLAADIGHQCKEILGEDRATMMLRARSGGAVTLIGDFMAHGHPPMLSDKLEILGSEGAINLRGDELILNRGGVVTDSHHFNRAVDYKASYADAIAHFISCIRSGAPFETAPIDNLQTLDIIETAYRIGARPHFADA